MSLAVVKAVRAKFPTPLGAQHAAFLVELAQTLNKGLLKKTSGTRIKLPAPWNVEVAQDIVCGGYDINADTVLHYDVLADGEGAAKPTWRLVGPIDASRYVDVSGTPDPEPDPEPIPPPPIPDPQPAPPAPVPCKPLVDYEPKMSQLGVEIGEILSAPTSPYRYNLPAACQVAVYLTHKVQYQKWTLEQARQDARERAGG